MSGWTTIDYLASYTAAAYFFIIGAILLFVPVTPGTPPAWLVEARLRYGGDANEPTPQAPSVRWLRISSISMFFLGVLQLLPRRYPLFDRPMLLVMGTVLLAFGLVMLIIGLRASESRETWTEKRQRQKFEQRVARGQDAYFEELRTILSQDTPPRRPPLWGFVLPILFILIGGTWLALGLATPR